MAQTIARDYADVGPGRVATQLRLLRRDAGGWIFLAPALLFFIGYQIWPIVRVVWLSFTDFQFLSDQPERWVGFDNYAMALSDPLMWVSLWRAALFTIM